MFRGFITAPIKHHGSSFGYLGCNIPLNDGDSFHGVCAALGANEFLGATVITNLFPPYLMLVRAL